MRSPKPLAAEPKQERACLIALSGQPTSPEAQELVTSLLDDVVLPHRLTLGHSKRAGAVTIEKLRTATQALIADLMNLARPIGEGGSPVAGAHGMSRNDFPSKGRLGFGYDIFHQVVGALEAKRLLTISVGYPRWGAPEGEKTGSATCFCLTDAMFELARVHGVEVADWMKHWTLRATLGASTGMAFVELRTKRTGDFWSTKQPPKSMRVDFSDPKVLRLQNQMQRMNDFFRSQRIDGFTFGGLRRIFNNGDQDDFDWNKGGRYYSVPGSQAYERLPARRREGLITINGEPVKEVDLRASHLTLLYALTGRTFDPVRDPYDIEDWPRIIVKLWIAQVLGSSNPKPTLWSRTSNADYAAERPDSDLGQDFPIREVGAAVTNKHPLLIELRVLKMTTLDLQYHEAEILRLAMEKLMFEQGVPVLPIHDALIAPRSRTAIVEDCLKLAFREYVEGVTGAECLVEPNVTQKGA